MIVATDHYAIRASGPVEIAGLDLVHERAGIGLMVGRLLDAYVAFTLVVIDIVADALSLVVLAASVIASLIEALAAH